MQKNKVLTKFAVMKEQNKKNSYFCGSQKGETMVPEKYVRFDWAVKRLLRDKANFVVLEGLVSVLLNEKITIVELLDSEANQDDLEDKFNRVDIKARNSKGEIIIVEVQQRRESDFLNRILYGVAKSITEHISIGDDYSNVKKIYSINIVYFNLGKGTDYLYHGQPNFTGINTHDTLQITEQQQNALIIRTPKEIFPEYYIIRVNEFDQVATTPLEEWLDYLKNGHIKDNTTAPGLREAREKLQYMMMSKEEQKRYFRYMDNWKLERNAMKTSHLDGLWEGRRMGKEEGLNEGLKKGKTEVVINMLTMNFDIDVISKATGLTAQEIEEIQKCNAKGL